jgi:hypothetical protein
VTGTSAAAASIARRLGAGQAALYRDLAAVLSEADVADAPTLRALIVDTLCGEFDPYRRLDGQPAAALEAAIAAVEVSTSCRVLLATVVAQFRAGEYDSPDGFELWVADPARHAPRDPAPAAARARRVGERRRTAAG